MFTFSALKLGKCVLHSQSVSNTHPVCPTPTVVCPTLALVCLKLSNTRRSVSNTVTLVCLTRVWQWRTAMKIVLCWQNMTLAEALGKCVLHSQSVCQHSPSVSNNHLSVSNTRPRVSLPPSLPTHSLTHSLVWHRRTALKIVLRWQNMALADALGKCVLHSQPVSKTQPVCPTITLVCPTLDTHSLCPTLTQCVQHPPLCVQHPPNVPNSHLSVSDTRPTIT